jgi:hypothetical protein
LANLLFSGVRHFNQFAFLHQFKQFPNAVSAIAIILPSLRSNRVVSFRASPPLSLTAVRHFNRLFFQRDFATFELVHWRVQESAMLRSIPQMSFSEFQETSWLIPGRVARFGISDEKQS